MARDDDEVLPGGVPEYSGTSARAAAGLPPHPTRRVRCAVCRPVMRVRTAHRALSFPSLQD